MKLEKITLQDVSDEYIRDDPFTDVRNVLNAVDELSAELMDCIIGKSGSGNTRDVKGRLRYESLGVKQAILVAFVRSLTIYYGTPLVAAQIIKAP